MKKDKKKKQTATARRDAILDRLLSEGEIFVLDMAADFGVTPMTIRRDLDALEERNALTRTHGGAIFSKQLESEFAFLERNRTSIEEKRAIARTVATLIKPRTSVVIDTSTTTLEVARALAGVEGLKVLTSSLAVASALHTRSNVEVVVLGGTVGKHWPDLTGSLTEDNLRRFSVDLAILGADALDPMGLYTTNPAVARVAEVMMSIARDTMLVADSGKFGHRSFVKYADWKQIRYFVTDGGVSAGDREWLENAVKEVHYAEGRHLTHRH